MSNWDACIHEPCPLPRWIECHPSTVLAVQAVAMFGAIVAEIAVPLWLAQTDRRRRAEEKRAMSGFFAAGMPKAFNGIVDAMTTIATSDINQFNATKMKYLDTLSANGNALSERVVEIVGEPCR